MTLLHDAFDATAERLAGKTALVSGHRRVTYAELRGGVDRLAARLQADGIERGDRVVLLLESDVEYALAVHAVLTIGAVVVPLGATTKEERLQFVLRDTDAAGLLVDEHLLPAGAVAASPTLRSVVRSAEFARLPLAAPLRPLSIDQDLAAIIYTSGSTGVPKGVMLSHHNMVSAWRSVQAYLGLTQDDVIGLALPPAFSYGLYNLLMGLGLGATVVLERAAFPTRLLETLAREKATILPAVPTLLNALLELPQLSATDLGALRLTTNAAAALPLRIVERVRSTWPRADLYSMYGMTECKRISFLPPSEIDYRPTSVGRGMPNQEHWLVDESGRRLPYGSTGELVVRGSHVMRGYWRRPEETARRLRPGPLEGERVLYTGDLFRTDADGWLEFVARTDDIIKAGGEKVAPREVEDVILRLSGVASCAVVGVDDEQLGQAVKAFVVLRPGTAMIARDVVRHCLRHLDSYMAPRQVEFVAELPLTESGKVRHAALRKC